MGTPNVKVSNNGTQYVDNSEYAVSLEQQDTLFRNYRSDRAGYLIFISHLVAFGQSFSRVSQSLNGEIWSFEMIRQS
jgi:hypothetical protein